MRNFLGFIAVVCLALLLAAPGAQAGAEFSLKYANVQPATHVTNLSAEWMANELERRSNGRIEMKIFPGGVLGRPNEMVDSLQVGDIDFAWISSANLATSIGQFNVFSLSYLFSSFDHYKNAFTKNSALVKNVSTIVDNSAYDIKLVGILGGVSRQLYNSERPVNEPADLDGIKLRVQKSPVEVKIWAALGAVPQQLSWTEIYTGLQTGVIQGAESSVDAFVRNKFYEVAKYLSLTDHQFLVLPLLMSKKTYNKLPPDLRQVVLDVAWESGVYCVKLYRDGEDDLIQKVKSMGVTVSQPDVSKFKSAVAGIVKEEAAKYGVGELLADVAAAPAQVTLLEAGGPRGCRPCGETADDSLFGGSEQEYCHGGAAGPENPDGPLGRLGAHPDHGAQYGPFRLLVGRRRFAAVHLDCLPRGSTCHP